MPDDELKNLLRRNLELAEDTNRMIHGMRRRALIGGLFSAAVWIIFFIVPAVVFYLYAQPYLKQMQDFVKSTQQFQSEFKGSDSQSILQKLYNDYMNSKGK